MNPERILKGESPYPEHLEEFMYYDIPDALYTLGNKHLLEREGLAIFCSGKSTPDIRLKSLEFCRSITGTGYAIVSGFHSAVEKKCLRVLVDMKHPTIMCIVKPIGDFQPSKEQRVAIEEGKMLVISTAAAGSNPSGWEALMARDRLVAGIAKQVLFLYAHPQGKTEDFFMEVITHPRTTFAIDDEANYWLFEFGAKRFAVGEKVPAEDRWKAQ